MRHTTKMFLLFLAAISMMLTSCVTTQHNIPTPSADTDTFKVGVQVLVASYIEKKSERQVEALRIINQMKLYIDLNEEISVDELQKRAMEWVPWSELELSGRIIIYNLVQYISDGLREQVGTGTLNPGEKVPVIVFLNWMEEMVMIATLGSA